MDFRKILVLFCLMSLLSSAFAYIANPFSYNLDSIILFVFYLILTIGVLLLLKKFKGQYLPVSEKYKIFLAGAISGAFFWLNFITSVPWAFAILGPIGQIIARFEFALYLIIGAIVGQSLSMIGVPVFPVVWGLTLLINLIIFGIIGFIILRIFIFVKNMIKKK